MANLISSQVYVAMQREDSGSLLSTPITPISLRKQLVGYLSNRNKLVALLLVLTGVIGTIILIVSLSSAKSQTQNSSSSNGARQAYMSEGRARLIKKLFSNYDKRDHPRKNTVTIGLTLLKFEHYKHYNIYAATMWLSLDWTDPRFRWTPSDFDGEKVLSIPTDNIWIPDITLYNREGSREDCQMTNAVIEFNGKVKWIPTCYFQPLCAFNEKRTEQVCEFKFGSWTRNGDELDLQPRHHHVDVSSYIENADWELNRTEIKRNSIVHECCPDAPIVDVTAFLVFNKRLKTLIWLFNLFGNYSSDLEWDTNYSDY